MAVAAMSGGVDSSVAAALLLEQGYDVVGVTLNVWPGESCNPAAKSCCAQTDVDDARRVCSMLGIPHYVLNMREPFDQSVIEYFVRAYLRGETPNPCIACNKHIKFGALLERARALGADFIATGHYAQTSCENGRRCLRRAGDAHKDQTYVLYTLTQDQLSALLLPCGGMTKPQVRQKALELGLPVHAKPDSQDICFIGAEGYRAFVRGYCAERGIALPEGGDVVDQEGRVLGRHDGFWGFTIGQRKGLGKYTDTRAFVTAIDARTGTVTLGGEADLLRRTMEVGGMNVMLPGRLCAGAKAGVKIRYSAPEAPCTVLSLQDGRAAVEFDTPQKSVTPGQAAVFYDGDLLLGGGTILPVERMR